MKTAVVILNWNGIQFLSQFLSKVVEFSSNQDCEIIVADNHSTDNSISYLKENFPEIKLIILDKNYGFAEGYNLALRQLDHQYFVLLNSDVEVTPNWILPIVNFMEINPEVAACMPKILSQFRKTHFEYAGAAGGFIDKFGYPFCRGRILSEVEIDNGQYNDKSEIFWATGACMYVRSSVYKELGGLDPLFFAHMEEIDLCWRMKRHGYKIYNVPEVTVYHVGGGTLPNESPRKLMLNYRNNLWMLYKNLPSSQLYSTLIVRMILDGFSAFVYLLTFKFSYFYSVFFSHIQFYKKIKHYRKKRKEDSYLKVTDCIYNRSIVYDFIINKLRKFSQLRIPF